LISLVVPVYNEAEIINQFLEAVRQSLDALGLRREIILVDDGSTDATWPMLLTLSRADAAIGLVRLSRNFGKEAAIMAGLEQAAGDAVIVLDADLQHPPSLLQAMVERWRGGGVDIVDAVKVDNRAEPALSRLSSRVFNRLFNRLTGYELAGASDFKLLDRRVVTALREMQSYTLFFRGTTLWLGFRHDRIPFEVPHRPGGVSKWGMMARLRLAINAITSFTALPLHAMTLVGLLSLLFAVLLGVQTLYNKFSGAAIEGFTTVIILLLLFGSLITLGLGTIGAYLSKIHDEVRRRPRYLITECRPAHGRDPDARGG
jgi:glycosyltransferase involved in cell wall biosynthesis